MLECFASMHQTFAIVDQFATIKSAKPKLLLVNTHDSCQNALAKGQIFAHSQRFSPAKYFSNLQHSKQ